MCHNAAYTERLKLLQLLEYFWQHLHDAIIAKVFKYDHVKYTNATCNLPFRLDLAVHPIYLLV
jgi:hypothetical protein